MLKKLFAITIPLFIFATLATPVLAQAENRLRGNDCLYENIATINCAPVVFANLIFWLIMLSGTVALFFIIFGGIKLLISGGDQKKIEDARKTLTWAIIGLVVVLFSFGIVTLIAETTGVRCITNFGFANCGRSAPGAGDSTCGPQRPHGSCTDGRSCVRISNSRFACRHLCGNDHTNGWCRTGYECKSISSNGIVYGWGCQPRD